MSHVTHLAKNRALLTVRAHVVRLIREWFWQEGFLEAEAPQILRLPGQEPHLSPMKLAVHDERGREYAAWLHTSPEYAMKKMLAAGFERIFALGKVFRDYESFGGTHNPEFTMLEWYRAGAYFYKIMDDVERLLAHVTDSLLRLELPGWSLPRETANWKPFKRVRMRELWQEQAGVNLDEYLEREAMLALCRSRGYAPGVEERYEDLFYRIFLNEIEPRLADMGAVIVHHYPLPMAALARASEAEPGYAERFEVYLNGLELANAFGELTDPAEQRRRLIGEQAERRAAGKDVFDVDEEFIEALVTMPDASGIALGVDRLVQALSGCKNIDDVLVLPMSKLMNN
ncbi:MAG: Lysyl-tRNA synthetase-related protein GenX [Candidatus Magasanikbacteria bacterium GW2011_GWA2_56_11]|uniref:Lysyl-tRNA synthetase-related protein GenX n=1 Tax=Candidatus Magasanikbacteria bacterium GW2011_GWA2_56_11 TaxID=1619044 RepID=A0A0G1YFV8_9BACT|nr:MAG: Lysyl-tRNA synthetase-related protein GenX [Candidatus Magasanikbacteria bacterium GW2011_GWA2_56_11]